MLNLNNDYIKDFWLNTNIVDCTNITVQTDELDESEIILNNESEIIILDYEDDKEKLNKDCKNNNEYTDYKDDKGRTNKQNSRIDKSNIPNKNSKNKHKLNKNTEDISNNKYINKKGTCKYNKLYNKSSSNNNKKQMCSLSQTSRIYEFKSRERKMLLDSCSEDKLDYNKKFCV